MVALTTAFFTAALALIGNIVLSFWRLDQDRRGVAAALASEIGAYVRPSARVAALREMAAYDHAMRRQFLRAVPRPPEGYPVFDKVADKIGLLPVPVSRDVSAIYAAIANMRSALSYLSSGGFADIDDKDQISFLLSTADRIERDTRDAPDLVERLTLISHRGWRTRLRAAWRAWRRE